MNYGAIKLNDIANGPGVRVSLFVSGCTNCCPGCFQPETWDFDYGKKFTVNDMSYILDGLSPDYVHGLTILGGDPLHPRNVYDVENIVSIVKYAYPEKSIWLYTGYTYEDLIATEDEDTRHYIENIFKHIDVLVDGPFIEAEKDLTLYMRGSRNQRILYLRDLGW